MAVNLLEAPFTELRWIPGEGRDGYPAGFAGILILLDILLVDRPIFAHFPAWSKRTISSFALASLLMSRRICSWE